MNEVFALLDATAKEIGIDYNQSSITRCIHYISLLHKWNHRTNLVGKNTPYDIASDLCIDSIHLAYILQQTSFCIRDIIDCGAGAGIPGIPLRCFYSSGTYTMIECRQKRGLFIEQALRVLSLPHTFCKIGRVEEVFHSLSFDTLISRAFMPPDELLPFANELLLKGQYLILMLNTSSFSLYNYSLLYSYSYSINKKTRYICILEKQ